MLRSRRWALTVTGALLLVMFGGAALQARAQGRGNRVRIQLQSPQLPAQVGAGQALGVTFAVQGTVTRLRTWIQVGTKKGSVAQLAGANGIFSGSVSAPSKTGRGQLVVQAFNGSRRVASASFKTVNVQGGGSGGGGGNTPPPPPF